MNHLAPSRLLTLALIADAAAALQWRGMRQSRQVQAASAARA
jgi:hypothetical protein